MLTLLVSLQQGNVKQFEKLTKIVNIQEENLHILCTSWKISMKFSGKMWLMIVLKVTKKQGFTLSLKNTFWVEIPQVDVKLTPTPATPQPFSGEYILLSYGVSNSFFFSIQFLFPHAVLLINLTSPPLELQIFWQLPSSFWDSSYANSSSYSLTPANSQVLIGKHLVFCSLTWPASCNAPQKCTPVK